MLPLLLWLKKLLLGVGIGVGYKLCHNGVGKKEIEDLNWSNHMAFTLENERGNCFHALGEGKICCTGSNVGSLGRSVKFELVFSVFSVEMY